MSREQVRSTQIAKKRLKNGEINSRGLSSLRFYYVHTMMASVKTRNGNCYNRFASLQTPYSFLYLLPRVQEPAAIRPSGIASSRRTFAQNSPLTTHCSKLTAHCSTLNSPNRAQYRKSASLWSDGWVSRAGATGSVSFPFQTAWPLRQQGFRPQRAT